VTSAKFYLLWYFVCRFVVSYHIIPLLYTKIPQLTWTCSSCIYVDNITSKNAIVFYSLANFAGSKLKLTLMVMNIEHLCICLCHYLIGVYFGLLTNEMVLEAIVLDNLDVFT